MSVSSFEELMGHVGHTVAIATYGNPPHNVAVECEDCDLVLFDFDQHEEPYFGGGVDEVVFPVPGSLTADMTYHIGIEAEMNSFVDGEDAFNDMIDRRCKGGR